MKFDDQLFLGKRSARGLKRKRLAPKPNWPDGPLDPVPGGGTVEVQLRDGRRGIMPMTYNAITQRCVQRMVRHDHLNASPVRRELYERSLDRNYRPLNR